MLLATDLDGSIDADPQLFQHLFSALRAAGDKVVILTGVKNTKTVTAADVQQKRAYLTQLGFDAFDQLIVFPDDGQLPKAKAEWCAQHDVRLLVDNSKANCRAVASTCLVLTPWATRVK